MQKTGNWPYILISLLLLALGAAGMVRQADVALLPPDFPINTIDWPITASEVIVTTPADLVFLVEGLHPGDLLQVKLSSGPQTFITVAAHSRSYLIIATVSGLFFWVVAFAVFVPRLNLPAVTQFYWITMLYGLGILLGGVYFQFELTALGVVLNVLQLCNLAFLPAVFLDMTLVFPRQILSSRWVRVMRISVYGVAVLLVAWQALMFIRYFQNPTPAGASGLHLPQLVADLTMVAQASIAMMIMMVQAGKLHPGRERQQARWLLTGFMVGATPYLFFRTVPMMFSLEPPFPAQIDRLFEPAIPLAFVFAVVRYRFLDIDLILRRGILYGILAAGMAGLILIPTTLMGPESIINWPRTLQMLPVLCGLMAGFLFLPLRKFLGRLIDRTFFRIEHRVDVILLEIKQLLKSVSSQEDLAKLIHEQINKVVAAEPCLVLIKTPIDEIRIGDADGSFFTSAMSCVNSPAPIWVQPNQSTCPELEDTGFPQALLNEDFVVALGLEADQLPVGCILLGPKTIGHRYVETDLKFLSEVALAASHRLHEIRLIQKMTEEMMKRTQLTELNQLKNDFLSKVAHDLRTPVTSVGWSISNLLDELAGPLQPRQREYLESMGISLEHLNNLVSTLLEISRLKKAKVEIPLAVCDLKPILTQVLGTTRPLAEAADVQFSCPPNDISLQLVTNAAKLAEVLINIVENGIRYSPLGGVLEIGAEAQENLIVLTVRDHGPGFQEIGDPFARFAQGQPSPHSDSGGYGLGLTIAQEYTQLMKGEISARNHPDGGAEFTLKFPTP
jgi:signal transduction histidine kinase